MEASLSDASVLNAGGLDASRVPSKRRDLIESAGGFALILLVMWTPRPYQRALYLVPVLWIADFTWLSFKGWREMGWRQANLLRSFWVVGVAAAMAAISVAISARLGTLHAPASPFLLVKTYWGYAIWSYEQQFLLLDFFLTRSMRMFSKPIHAACAVAAVFALAHLPNPVLVPMTALWGFAACLIFLKYRNLWPMGLAHAIFGICVAVAVPAHLTHNMRVGLGYWRFRPRTHDLQRRNSDQMVSTQAWVKADAATRLSARQALP